MTKRFRVAVMAAVVAALPGITHAQEASSPPHQEWSFNGIFGTYNDASLQRGFQVWKQICSACHPAEHLYFRDLAQIGYSEDEIKALAATYQVTAGPNDKGLMYKRPARPADHIPGPFANDEAAKAANNGALPPDHSLIILARPDGPDYVYALLNGYTTAPPDVHLAPGMYYNEYFPGHAIAMPPPLSPNAVKFADGTPATVPQMAHDVVSFLTWAAEPNLPARHRMGFKVFFFLIVSTGVFYAAKRKIWSRLH
jgi:ubiquinol-cytochrome c reductase cytochrome c1 subunit